ncbi:hypothetical protein ACWCPD_41005 [Streptomyces sp. NPDC001935]
MSTLTEAPHDAIRLGPDVLNPFVLRQNAKYFMQDPTALKA